MKSILFLLLLGCGSAPCHPCPGAVSETEQAGVYECVACEYKAGECSINGQASITRVAFTLGDSCEEDLSFYEEMRAAWCCK